MSKRTGEQYLIDDSSPGTNIKDAQQVALALQLVIMQIDTSLRESDKSVGQMIDNITSLSGSLQRINTHLEEQAPARSILSDCIQANEHIQQVIMALQYYDRLSQRFSHVRDNLTEIISVLSAPDREHDALWCNLQRRMRTVYSQEQEQVMYQALHEGQSAEEPGNAGGTCSPSLPNGDVELF